MKVGFQSEFYIRNRVILNVKLYIVPLKPIRADKKYDQMESFGNSEDDVSTIVKALRKAGRDGSKQLPGLIKLGEWYLDKGKATTDSADFTKANAL